jgi:hypothetical protein
VIIEEVHVEGIALVETEYDPPIAANGDTPKAFQVAAQPMKSKALDIHVVNRNGSVQAREQTRYLVGQIRPQLASIIVLEQSSEPAMPNASDHRHS